MAEQQADRLLSTRQGCEKLGITPYTQYRREKDPPAGGWPTRRVVGRTGAGRSILAFSEREIDAFIAGLPRVTHDPKPEWSAQARKAAAKAQAKREAEREAKRGTLKTEAATS